MTAGERRGSAAGDPLVAARVEEALRRAAPDGRIACACAGGVAEQLAVPLAEVRRGIERLGIKVTGCQLGCF